MFAVIIPYFQRTRGTLARTLHSIARQDFCEPVTVYVIDDESPVPPEPEVAAVEWPTNFAVRILGKRNGGPGSARNLGLDSLADERYVAFLDSDDCWQSHHLSAAKFAFELGFDFYTADWIIDEHGTRAHEHFYGPAMKTRPVPGADWGRELDDDLMNYTVSGPIGSTCSMALTRELVSGIRFDNGLRTAGEDGLFATRLAAKRPRVFLSQRVDVDLGEGVNIFSSDNWNSRAGLMRDIYFLRSRLLMRPLAASFPTARERLEDKLQAARRNVLRSFLSGLKHGQFPAGELFSLLRLDPALLTTSPVLIYEILSQRKTGSTNAA